MKLRRFGKEFKFAVLDSDHRPRRKVFFNGPRDHGLSSWCDIYVLVTPHALRKYTDRQKARMVEALDRAKMREEETFNEPLRQFLVAARRVTNLQNFSNSIENERFMVVYGVEHLSEAELMAAIMFEVSGGFEDE